MTSTQRKNLVLAGVGGVIVASIVLGYFASGPGRASAPDEAIKAAEAIRQQAGGGTQPTDEHGVPLDAVMDPNSKSKPGRVESSPTR